MCAGASHVRHHPRSIPVIALVGFATRFAIIASLRVALSNSAPGRSYVYHAHLNPSRALTALERDFEYVIGFLWAMGYDFGFLAIEWRTLLMCSRRSEDRGS